MDIIVLVTSMSNFIVLCSMSRQFRCTFKTLFIIPATHIPPISYCFNNLFNDPEPYQTPPVKAPVTSRASTQRGSVCGHPSIERRLSAPSLHKIPLILTTEATLIQNADNNENSNTKKVAPRLLRRHRTENNISLATSGFVSDVTSMNAIPEENPLEIQDVGRKSIQMEKIQITKLTSTVIK